MAVSRRDLLGSAAGMMLVPAFGTNLFAQVKSTSELTSSGVELSSTSVGRLCMNLYAPTYFGGFNPFLNWWKLANPATIVRLDGSRVDGAAVWEQGFLSADTGDLINPVPANVRSLSRVFHTDANSAFSGEEWIVRWDGSATCTIIGLTQGGQVISNQPGLLRFRMGSNPTTTNTVASFLITNRSDPPRNIRIYQSRYASNVDAGEKFNPDWLKQVRQFGILRFMGWMPTNFETISEFSQLATEDYFAWCQPKTATSGFGPKGSIHPSLICQLANITRCNIHVCIPHQATDAFVREFASYFRDKLDRGIVVTFEYSNECWNWGFTQTRYCLDQGAVIWPGDSARFAKWYGYRAAQCMKIVRDVYNDRTRWRGCLATQTGAAAIANYSITGAQLAISGMGSATTSTSSMKIPNVGTTSAPSPSPVTLNELFHEISGTGYFGDVQTCKPATRISNSSPAVVTSAAHGFVNGTRLRVFVSAGMTHLNGAKVVVANATRDTFELAGVDTTALPAFIAGNNYVVRSEVFDLMDESEQRFQANPTSFPTKYSHFNRVMAQSWLTGSAGGITTVVSVASLKNTYWPATKAVADRYGMEFRQYEGGLHFVGDAYLNGYGGNPRFTEFLVAAGHSEETGNVYDQCYSSFVAIGGRYPAKFVEAGRNGPYGCWAGLRQIPGDDTNPVWRATLKANGSRV